MSSPLPTAPAGVPAPRDVPVLAHFAPELLALGATVRVAIFDIDGCLTDGQLYMDGDGERFKAFHSLDGHGLKLIAQAGITPLIITGRDSSAVRKRVADLGITHACFGVHDKLAAAHDWLTTQGHGWDALAVIGDDWPDLPLMLRARLACAPANAHIENRAAAHYVTHAQGGHGAGREFCDLLLMACGAYDGLLRRHAVTLDDGLRPPP